MTAIKVSNFRVQSESDIAPWEAFTQTPRNTHMHTVYSNLFSAVRRLNFHWAMSNVKQQSIFREAKRTRRKAFVRGWLVVNWNLKLCIWCRNPIFKLEIQHETKSVNTKVCTLCCICTSVCIYGFDVVDVYGIGSDFSFVYVCACKCIQFIRLLLGHENVLGKRLL